MLENIDREDDNDDLDKRGLELPDTHDLHPAGKLLQLIATEGVHKKNVDPVGDDEQYEGKEECINCLNKGLSTGCLFYPLQNIY